MPRQDSLDEQMADVMKKAVEMGCYDAHNWLLRNFVQPSHVFRTRPVQPKEK